MYTNSLPHIGFAFESIQADVLARYHRLLGNDVFFLTGTDEHGVKVAKAAEEARKEPKEFVDDISKKVIELKEILNLSNDDFIRTTDQKRHWPAVKKVWLKLKETGDIYEKKYKGLYCSGCESFLTKKDLVDGKCAIHQTEAESIEEENYFFKLSKYSKQIAEAIKRDELKVIPETRKNEILSFIKQGLEDVSFSRPREKFQWGIPVPDDENQILYVWADALTNYISAIGYFEESEKFKKLWPTDVHCIGKDILRFHAAIWPGMLLSLKLSLPKTIFVHGFITVGGQKMSKSLRNIIDPFELVKKYGTDAVRYFLLREIPSTEDGDFTYEKFEKRYNSDLAKGLGNLVARTLTMVEKYCDGRVPKIDRDPDSHPLRINQKIHNWKKSWQDLDNALTNTYQFSEALSSIWKFISEADRYIEENRPWDLFEEGKHEELNWVLYGLLDAIHQIAWQILIFLPDTVLKIAEALKLEKILVENPSYKDSWTNIKPGIQIKKIKPLFPKL
jgi:methionyl-tRNA synthetase